MSDRVPCRLCGSAVWPITNLTVDDVRVEACCIACAEAGASIPYLAHSIARFLRRAEVGELVDEVGNANFDYRVSVYDDSPGAVERQVNAQKRIDTALARLAAIALEER